MIRWREIYKVKNQKSELVGQREFSRVFKVKANVVKGWAEVLQRKKERKLGIKKYFEAFLRKIVKSWVKLVKEIKEFKVKVRKSRRLYRKALKEKLFLILKNQPKTRSIKLRKLRQSVAHHTLNLLSTTFKACKLFSKKRRNAVIVFNYLKTSEVFLSKKSNFLAWLHLFHKHQHETALYNQVIQARRANQIKILFNDWVRAFNTHFHLRTKNSNKISAFQSKQSFKLLVQATKSWIRLYKSKENYRKLKKLSTKVFVLKRLRHCFLGFSIIFEKFKIKNIKLFKASQFSSKNILKRWLGTMKKHTMYSLNIKFQNLEAIQFWAHSHYRKTLRNLMNYNENRKKKKRALGEAERLRKSDLQKSAARLLIHFGLTQKVAREEEIRQKIIKENIRKLNCAKKYAKIWLSKIKLKKDLIYEKYRYIFIN